MVILGDHHRLFLQLFFHHRICNAQEVRKLFEMSHEKFNVEMDEENRTAELIRFVNQINVSLKPTFEIRKGVAEDDGSQYYALVNCVENSVTLLCKDFEANELEYFKLLVKSIVESAEGKISSVDALNLMTELEKRFSKSEAEVLIESFINDKWMKKKEGQLFLDVRAIIELQPYIREMFEDVAVCPQCHIICLMGYTCDHCDAKFHHHCKKRFLKHAKKPKCPSCKNSWEDLEVEENGNNVQDDVNDDDSEDDNIATSSSRAGRKRRREL